MSIWFDFQAQICKCLYSSWESPDWQAASWTENIPPSGSRVFLLAYTWTYTHLAWGRHDYFFKLLHNKISEKEQYLYCLRFGTRLAVRFLCDFFLHVYSQHVEEVKTMSRLELWELLILIQADPKAKIIFLGIYKRKIFREKRRKHAVNDQK